MVGIAGRSGGANKKRTEERLGKPNFAQDDPRHHNAGVDRPIATGDAEQPPLQFPDGEEPVEMVASLWRALTRSGFHEYYTDADWEYARTQMYHMHLMVLEMIEKRTLSAMKSAELRAIGADLLLTESSRRRLRLEVQRSAASKAPAEEEPSHITLAKELA